ncbi:hypothetical protein ETAA8_06630 [Anatilimnocola aggregata]|uniref:Uncharacterized protein n=1 Tax=Anatilimnocola aggregata TaxID=2528021 RepID=A0A517Y5T0_9BACT|nr:hypothetical protein [Anatilimnocola aggregata]QDU25593.1 hypothetical protein ETAA8_06630 [Anatilimnocola aggregata]
MLTDEDVQQITEIVRAEVAKAMKPKARRYGLRGSAARLGGNSVPVASADREAKIVAAIRDFDKKRRAYELQPGESLPGAWYFYDLSNLVILAANGPMPEGFGAVYRCITSIAKTLLTQHNQAEPITRQYPCNELVTCCGSLAMILSRYSEGNGLPDPEEFLQARQLREAKTALEAIRQSNGDTSAASLYFSQMQRIG